MRRNTGKADGAWEDAIRCQESMLAARRRALYGGDSPDAVSEYVHSRFSELGGGNLDEVARSLKWRMVALDAGIPC